MRRPVLLLIIGSLSFGVVLAILILRNPTLDPDSSSVGTSLVNGSAPDFTVTTLDGDTLRLSQLRGNVVFLNFWATWCIPCQREMPAFQSIVENTRNVVVLAVNADGESAEAANAFITDYNAPDVTVGLTPNDDIRDRYGVAALPTTYFIDPQGIIRTVRFGEVTEDDMNEFLAFLVRTTP
ncbi:MAG: TlpA disulfide reductase family protein [Chloroflexota bacterium]